MSQQSYRINYSPPKSTSQNFHRFPHLPPHIRTLIWTYTTLQPRTIGIQELHSLRPGFGTLDTRLISTSRPPALLSVCKESRIVGLDRYRRVERDVSKVVGGGGVWVGGNDVVWRGKRAVGSNGEGGFLVRTRGWEGRVVEVAWTDVVAVDWGVLGRMGDEEEFVGRRLSEVDVARERRSEGMRRNFEDIRRCVGRGVKEIWVVVGNEDDISETEFIPLIPPPPAPSHSDIQHQYQQQESHTLTPHESSILTQTQEFSSQLSLFWQENQILFPIPKIEVRTPRRKELSSFSRFKMLPVELQDLIWSFAGRGRERVLFSKLIQSEAGGRIGVRRLEIPSLLRTTMDSRAVMKKVVEWRDVPIQITGLGRTVDGEREAVKVEKGRKLPILKDLDILVVEEMISPILYEGWKGGVGFEWKSGKEMLCGRHVRRFFSGVERIVVLVGKKKGNCEIVMEGVGLDGGGRLKGLKKRDIRELVAAREYARGLRADLEAMWDEERDNGIEFGEWRVPRVELGVMRYVSEVWNPFL